MTAVLSAECSRDSIVYVLTVDLELDAADVWCEMCISIYLNENHAERYVGPKYHNLEQGVESRYCLHAAMAATTFYRSAPALGLRLAPLVLLRTGRRCSLPAGWTRIACCYAIGGEYPHGSQILSAGWGSLAAARASEARVRNWGLSKPPTAARPAVWPTGATPGPGREPLRESRAVCATNIGRAIDLHQFFDAMHTAAVR
eukprot:CAMPEP_0204533890 /NCGR_PEP_ID=MMETSP0661-20131031/12554_1 /ASSEMBLY_ACC=CAM_ASM_000606 /TAXON_ID=109239 /ORGANISM="Alexandrium margalefi, Strain AMGDE01CS-322" /LENGTH=200 /DNA_ID=CAMNT_0051540295 /DNA_START=95 /DNA_END=697 /DNA_ORIENTATION=-